MSLKNSVEAKHGPTPGPSFRVARTELLTDQHARGWISDDALKLGRALQQLFEAESGAAGGSSWARTGGGDAAKSSQTRIAHLIDHAAKINDVTVLIDEVVGTQWTERLRTILSQPTTLTNAAVHFGEGSDFKRRSFAKTFRLVLEMLSVSRAMPLICNMTCH